MRYFAEFPTITYQIAGTGGAYKLVPDIFRRVRARSKILGNLSFLDAYDINEGSMKVSINETSDFVSKYYINASKEEQTLIRLFVITHVLALYESYDDSRYEKLEGFAYRTIELLGRFGNLFT